VRATRLAELHERGHRLAAAALALRRDPERFLATVQIGITVVGASAAAFGGAALAQRLAPVLAGTPALEPYADQLALGLVVALVSYLSIVVGELVPKSLALRASENYALAAALPLLGLAWLARPLVWFLTASSNLVLRPFGDRTTFSETRYSAEELQQLVEDAMKSGSLHPQAADIASRALEFQELVASDVMVPRHDVVTLERHSSLDEIRRVLVARPHTRLPIHEEIPDRIVGYVNIKDLTTRTFQTPDTVLDDVMRPAYFVPESKPAVDLLREMRQRRTPLAIVIDGQGGLVGIVTLEDLVEELVGDIFSEHTRETSDVFTRDPSGTFTVAGTVQVRELNRELDLDLPEDGDWNTIAGLCIALAERIPVGGDRFELPNGTALEVVDASARRVRSVRIHPPPLQAEVDDEPS
jgi:putative hemolysin